MPNSVENLFKTLPSNNKDNSLTFIKKENSVNIINNSIEELHTNSLPAKVPNIEEYLTDPLAINNKENSKNMVTENIVNNSIEEVHINYLAAIVPNLEENLTKPSTN